MISIGSNKNPSRFVNQIESVDSGLMSIDFLVDLMILATIPCQFFEAIKNQIHHPHFDWTFFFGISWQPGLMMLWEPPLWCGHVEVSDGFQRATAGGELNRACDA